MKNFVQSVVLLLAIAAVTVATSNNEGKNLPVVRSYTVASDCSNATVTTGTLIATDNKVTSPLNTTYLNVGLPVSEMIVGGETTVTGTIAPALVRSCTYATVIVGANTTYVYVCSDNAIYACTVSLTQL